MKGKFLSIGVPFEWPKMPKNPLDIPPAWARHWAGDFPMSEADFVNRTESLRHTARENRRAIKEAGDQPPREWYLAFEVGEIETTSHLTLENGAKGEFCIDASLSLVKPTQAEVTLMNGKL